MKILVENSTWNNIGDGFYQTSILNLFRKVFTESKVDELEGPLHRAFKPKRFSDRGFHLNLIQEADVYVLSGPILSSAFANEYGELIKTFKARNSKYAILSAHGNGSCLERNKEILRSHPPIAFATRDTPTFEMYKDCCQQSYDGVCAASLVSKTCQTADVDKAAKYITVSFYDAYEPEISIDKDLNAFIPKGNHFDKDPKWKFRRHTEFLKDYPKFVDDYEIVRPVHDIGYGLSHLNYAKTNSFLSYNPLSYLSLYRGTSLTISNRIHAVLPTLSYGKPAMYFGKEKRDALFSRLGLKSHVNTKLTLSEDFIESEYEAYLSFIRNIQW